MTAIACTLIATTLTGSGGAVSERVSYDGALTVRRPVEARGSGRPFPAKKAASLTRSGGAVSERTSSGAGPGQGSALSGVDTRRLVGSETVRAVSGAGRVASGSHPKRIASPASETACTYAQHRQLMRAVRFYTWKIRNRVNQMGAGRAGLAMGHLPDYPRKMGARATDAIRSASGGHARAGRSLCPRFLAKYLRAKAYATRARYERWVREQARERRSYFARLYEKWRCIHEHEGAWNDPGYPHWGGLQMDMGFQQTYGPEFLRRWGTADNWPVWAQLTAAERAYHGYAGYGGRGFTPWPNTARMCGLL